MRRRLLRQNRGTMAPRRANPLAAAAAGRLPWYAPAGVPIYGGFDKQAGGGNIPICAVPFYISGVLYFAS
jgi:hypothetical protein